MPDRWADRVAVVTGGASGIGHALAHERDRARVVISWDYVLIDLVARLSPSGALWAVQRLAPRLPF